MGGREERQHSSRLDLRDGQALTFETTVRAIVSRLDLVQNQQQLKRRRSISDNSSQPSAVALSDSGAYAFITAQGNNRLIAMNQLGTSLRAATPAWPCRGSRSIR